MTYAIDDKGVIHNTVIENHSPDEARHGELLRDVAEHGVRHLVADDDAELVVILAEVQHAAEHEDVAAREDERVPDWLVHHGHCPALVVYLAQVLVPLQQSVGHSDNSAVELVIVWKYVFRKFLKQAIKLLSRNLLDLIWIQGNKSVQIKNIE